MEQHDPNTTFQYTYSAKEQEEVKKIREKYLPNRESKLDKLRQLDAAVTQKATIWSLVVGILGALIMGIGMSLSMTDIGVGLFGSAKVALILGIILGLIGIAMACLAYPLYQHLVKKERERIAPKIMQLTDELIK